MEELTNLQIMWISGIFVGGYVSMMISFEFIQWLADKTFRGDIKTQKGGKS